MTNLSAMLSKLMRSAAFPRAAARRVSSLVLLGISLWGLAAAPAMATEVVFVLGEDSHGSSGYFSAAEAYYRHTRPSAITITTLRSLAEVREYLVRRRGDDPWTRIVIVAHGTPWKGLLVPLYSDGPRATLIAMEEAIVRREFPALPSGVIAADASIVLESCGVGRRGDYLRALGNLFRADIGPAPKVEAAHGFVAFYASKMGAPQRWELPIAVRVLRGGPTSWSENRLSLQVDRLRESLASLEARVSQHPLKVVVDFPQSGATDHRQAERIAATDAKVLRQLRSLGISPASLRWKSQAVGNGPGLRVVGEALALIAYDEAEAHRVRPAISGSARSAPAEFYPARR